MIHLTLDRGTASDTRTAHLEQAADELGVQVIKVAPLALLESALTNLRRVRTLLAERQPTSLQMRLVRTSAKLSNIVGEILFNAGGFSQAREWYKTAEHAANDAGDRYLADIALGGLAYLPTYSDDPRGVIALLTPRLDSGPTATPAVSWLWGLRARAHAALDEATDFNRAIENARECLARSSQELIIPGIFSCVPQKLAFYEANGAVLLNEPQRALQAADRALAIYDMSETTEPALVQLDRASALVQSREASEACRLAVTAVTAPATYRSVSVRTRARRFNHLLGSISTPAADDWRDTYRRLFVEPKATKEENGK